MEEGRKGRGKGRGGACLPSNRPSFFIAVKVKLGHSLAALHNLPEFTEMRRDKVRRRLPGYS